MILAIDTSSRQCGVALWKRDLIACSEIEANLRHNEVLLTLIADLLKAQNLQPQDLAAVAVSSGPGSFTGLRVGMAAAKALCWAWKKPLLTVPTLEGLAASVPGQISRILPLISARARELYWSLFERKGAELQQLGDCSVSEISSLGQKVTGEVFLCGDGYGRHSLELEAQFSGRQIALPEGESLPPLAATIARLAAAKLHRAEFADLYSAEPGYYYAFPRSEIAKSAG